MKQSTSREASFSLPSILAMVAAIGSFFGGAFWQLMLALAAVVLGAIGVVISISPAKRGGVISLMSMAIGLIAVVIAVIRAVWWLIS